MDNTETVKGETEMKEFIGDLVREAIPKVGGETDMKKFIIELLIVAGILALAMLAHAQTTIIVTPVCN